MKYALLLLLLLSLKGKAQWTDDFSDGNFNSSPAWRGDSTKFIVNNQSELQLSAPAVTGSASLSTSSIAACKATWTFLIKMGFNPSSSNYSKIYVMSDQADLNQALNGYFVRVGGANDDLCLFRQEGLTETLIADGRDKVFNTTVVSARIKITRDASNHWELLCDSTGGENYKLSASTDDGTILTSGYFGVKCIYTSTRSTNFAFDDFQVTGEAYTAPKPAVDSTRLYDVVINEIMADPTPVAGLPKSEYLELYNRSGYAIDTKGWKLSIGSSSFIFPEVQIPVDGYLILTAKADTAKFMSFGQVLGLFTSSTTLNNTGQYLKLQNRDGRLIDWLTYDDSWYGDDFKAQGGWSLEQIDPFNPCSGSVNWKATKANSGGTPGAKNSVFGLNPDASMPDLLRVNVLNDSILQLYFSEPLDSTEAVNSNNYSVNKGIGYPKKVAIADQNYSSLQLSLLKHLLIGETYNLTIARKITDCVGNLVSREISISFGLPLKPESGDIAINEVLFNAKAGGVDYIELYNRSTKMVNARNLLIGTKVNGEVKNLCRLSETGFLIAPSDYLLISEDCEKVKPYYSMRNEKCFINLACMPSLDDKDGIIVLENDTFGRIDEFSYSEAMHTPTLKNLEGISLERINPSKPSTFPGNWHSAAETAGYGTPGFQNSQHLNDSVSESAIMLSDEIFSPDNDGYKDVLQVLYKFNDAGCRAQVTIFDASGRLVKRLMNNELLGTDGSFTWDGTSDAGKLCNVGMYVIFIRTVFDDGTVKEYKKSCVLAIKR